MESQGSLPVPSISHYLKYPWWELYEAAYILTKWPPCIHGFSLPILTSEKVGRGCIYGWGGGRFNAKVMGIQFGKVLSGIKKAMISGEIRERKVPRMPGYAYGTVSFIATFDVITWGLQKGLVFPDALSHEIGLYQIKKPELKKNCHQKVKNQIIGQFLLEKDSSLSVSSLSNHELMQKFGSWKDSNDQERRSIRRAIGELYGSKGSPGAPSKNGKKLRPYQPKPISLVVEKDPNGKTCYYFPLLKTAIHAAIDIKIDLIGQEEFRKMTELGFLEEFIIDPVVKLYIEGASSNSVKFVVYLVLEKIRTFYSHPKICTIPIENRNDMTIGQLSEINWEFCLEVFTPEERKMIDSKLDFPH